ncbi:Mur ligase family protein [Clostridium polynesiense]|uniref:Mur ligase family protein n=1 Tax=Clostridium polynesiense TaxID=1325933 RepID=UPI0005911C50|nr:Mur ligase family protein [Clostridium polynesiense]
MKVKTIRTLPGINIKEREKLIYIACMDSEKECLTLIEKYIRISKFLGFYEVLVDFGHEDREYHIWLTYTIEEAALKVLQSLLQGINEKYIIDDVKSILEKLWYRDILDFAEESGIPSIILENNSIQLGYGVNSTTLSEDKFLKEYKGNLSTLKKSITLNNNGNIPIISVTGTNGKTTTVRLIFKVLQKLGYKAGLASTGGIFIHERNIKNGDTTGFYSAREVLKHPEVEAAVLETARGGILKKGLGYKNSSAAVITSLSEDHIGMYGINDLYSLAKVKTTILKALSPSGKIIILAIPILYDMVDSKENLCLFHIKKNEIIKEHISSGGEALYIEDNSLIYFIKGSFLNLGDIRTVEFTHKGISSGNIKNIMAAIGAVSAIHHNISDIFNALKDIPCNLYSNPGRQNIFHLGKFKLILDYGHNSEAFKEVYSIAQGLNPEFITGIIAAPGDRQDRYIIELGSISAEYCSKIFIREQVDLRGRVHGECAELIKRGVIEKGFPAHRLKVIFDEREALREAMESSVINEVIVLFTQCINEIIPVVNKYIEENTKESIIII